MRHSVTLATFVAVASAAVFVAACSGASGNPAVQGTASADAGVLASERAAADIRAAASAAAEQAKKLVGSDAAAVAEAGRDIAITSKVHAALASDEQLAGSRILVDTEAGRVALSGTVPTDAARDRAEAIAVGVVGVDAVDNRLTIAAAV
jgi:hyperosmotically inducible periplasmic protein